MIFEQRPYQERAIPELREALRDHGSVVYVLPTGGGKTVVAAEVAKRAMVLEKRVLSSSTGGSWSGRPLTR